MKKQPKVQKKSKVKDQDEWVSPAAKSKARLAASIIADKVQIQQSEPLPAKVRKQQEERSALMGEIEARVEAASASRMWQRTVYLVRSTKDADQYYLVLDQQPDVYFTMYRDGAENGEGAFKTDGNTKKRSQVQTVNGVAVPKAPRTKSSKTPAVLSHCALTFDQLSTVEQTCLATIGKKEWVVQVRSGWCLMKSLVDQCKDGLIMVVKGQGYYMYPKTMWTEFAGIFTSRSYLEGSGYSQSVLPKKFDKYFTKFK